MKRFALLIGGCFVFTSTFCLATEPENLSTAKAAVRHYYQSGAYTADLNRVIDPAIVYLHQRVLANQHSKHPKKLAIVFDIDETLLSNYPSMNQEDFGGSMSEIEVRLKQGNDPAILPTKRLYDAAQKSGVTIFLITGRDESLRAATVKNLTAAGYTGWKALVLRKQLGIPKTIPYKSQARALIETKGYDVILSVGDQYSDLQGGYADRDVKLPDPFYFIP